jgi:hypothetical protein
MDLNPSPCNCACMFVPVHLETTMFRTDGIKNAHWTTELNFKIMSSMLSLFSNITKGYLEIVYDTYIPHPSTSVTHCWLPSTLQTSLQIPLKTLSPQPSFQMSPGSPPPPLLASVQLLKDINKSL